MSEEVIGKVHEVIRTAGAMLPDITRECECGKVMVLCRANASLCTFPPQHLTNWRCFGCDRKMPGPLIREKTQEDMDRERWERINSPELPVFILNHSQGAN